jgi:alkylation response protein AidB-like acyl-CoA dehydrogenase
VKLTFGADVEAFRTEFLAWVAENRPSDEEIEADPALSSAHIPDWARSWTRRMFDAGWLVPGWPPERGGRNASPIEALICQEELTRAHIPRTTNPQGLGIVAPSIFDYGSPEQIRDYAEPIMRGEKAACLGMSEPGAGSDLASLSTRAVLDGDRFVINGQKVWTSGANYADFCFLFCRTDTTVAKHKGISVILVEMDTPGITVRPLPEIVGPEHPDLNEVFFDDVLVPAENLVGQLNNGWAMANGSLAHERGMVWLGGVLMLEETMTRLLEEAPEALDRLPADERAVATDHLVQSYVDSVAARCLGYRGFAKLMRGGTAPEQALMKAFSSESGARLALAATELTGSDALDIGETTGFDRRKASWLERYFGTFGGTISAGSSEIQRNIIAEKVLGLPRS